MLVAACSFIRQWTVPIGRTTQGGEMQISWRVRLINRPFPLSKSAADTFLAAAWNASNPPHCQGWYGVSCCNVTASSCWVNGGVHSLLLPSNDLAGALPGQSLATLSSTLQVLTLPGERLTWPLSLAVVLARAGSHGGQLTFQPQLHWAAEHALH